MPVHEIACAVEAAPTRPIPQTIAPVATQLSPKPRRRRLKIKTLRQVEGEVCRKLVSVKPIPAAPHTNNPMHVVRFAPNLSAENEPHASDCWCVDPESTRLNSSHLGISYVV